MFLLGSAELLRQGCATNGLRPVWTHVTVSFVSDFHWSKIEMRNWSSDHFEVLAMVVDGLLRRSSGR